eukprot:6684284-Prymnesium_polylepis.2
MCHVLQVCLHTRTAYCPAPPTVLGWRVASCTDLRVVREERSWAGSASAPPRTQHQNRTRRAPEGARSVPEPTNPPRSALTRPPALPLQVSAGSEAARS